MEGEPSRVKPRALRSVMVWCTNPDGFTYALTGPYREYHAHTQARKVTAAQVTEALMTGVVGGTSRDMQKTSLLPPISRPHRRQQMVS